MINTTKQDKQRDGKKEGETRKEIEWENILEYSFLRVSVCGCMRKYEC